ncbi:MAG: hypothetical protein PHG68_03390 [Candidatus Omnitrophica bacterium]|nr:hypothetical protein [Candidatus Omnitrophota bacterium]
MKKLVAGVLLLAFASSLAFAQGAMPSTSKNAMETITLSGQVIDNMCASGHKNDLANFVKTHNKQCVLAPGCGEQTGYSLFSGGKLYKFSNESNAMVTSFLKKDENKLDVTVTAQKMGDELKLISIDNQK